VKVGLEQQLVVVKTDKIFVKILMRKNGQNGTGESYADRSLLDS